MQKDAGFNKNFIAGGIGGVVSKTIVSPLNVIKLQKQSKMTGFTHFSLLNYWKGNGYNCLRVFPHSGIQLSCFNYMKNRYGSNITYYHRLLFGIMAGSIGTITTYPLDTIHFRKAVYKSNINLFKNLYRGLNITILSTSLFSGIHLSIYDMLSSRQYGKKEWWHPMIYSSQASLISQSICYPLDTIRRTSQLIPSPESMYKTTKNIYNKHGIKGFYSGISYNAIKVMPTQAIRLSIFEYLISK